MERIELRTARTVLSPLAPADADAVHAACQDPAIQRYTPVPQPYPRQAAVDFIRVSSERWDAGTEGTWAIRCDGALTGVIGLHGLDPAGGGTGEIGYWMAAEHRGRGLLSEAARAVVDVAFSSTGPHLDRLQWRAAVGNEPSARVARALGFRYEGTLRSALTNGAGVRDDGWIAGLLPHDDRAPQPWPILVNP